MEVQARWRLLRVAAVAALLSGCGSESGPAPPTAPPPSQPQRYGVSSVVDGDTIRFSPALLGSSSLRFLNIDAPEIGGDTQEPWAVASRAHLQQLLPAAAEIAIETDQERTDAFARVLGHAIKDDGVNVNREQLRLGHAVLYVIWPNVAHFTEYREAQIEAQASGRGVWNAAAPLREQPFEFRLRQDGALPFRPVGDFLTRSYVQPADYRLVHVNNRVFFNSPAAADAAGYRACPTDAAGEYSASCFAPGSAADKSRSADRRRPDHGPRIVADRITIRARGNSPIPTKGLSADRIPDPSADRAGIRVNPRIVMGSARIRGSYRDLRESADRAVICENPRIVMGSARIRGSYRDLRESADRAVIRGFSHPRRSFRGSVSSRIAAASTRPVARWSSRWACSGGVAAAGRRLA